MIFSMLWLAFAVVKSNFLSLFIIFAALVATIAGITNTSILRPLVGLVSVLAGLALLIVVAGGFGKAKY